MLGALGVDNAEGGSMARGSFRLIRIFIGSLGGGAR
jgi:hypothetical protein